MNQVPIVKRKVLEQILISIGFEKINKMKHHALYKHGDGRMTAIPFYRGRKITRPLLNWIVKDMNIDMTEYCKIISEVTKKR